MEMLLMGACLSMLGVAVTCMAFGAATHPEEGQTEAQEVQAAVPAPGRFFVHEGAMTDRRVPIGALMLEIENHVRLEQAAAESFLQMPTPAMLHSRTMSTFVN
jgi:hypothetical protein